MSVKGRQNNFDLIRLFAATQVMILHTAVHLGLGRSGGFDEWFFRVISYFPGVPIFFSLSGFLITNAWVRKPGLMGYAQNRFLRLYPGLWVAFAFTLGILIYFGTIHAGNAFSPGVLSWYIGQLTFFQFFTPEALKSFGLGNPNGNLWTITVELQFYLLVPALWFISRGSKVRFWRLFTLLTLVGFGFSAWLHTRPAGIVGKMGSVFILPYLPFFWAGSTLCLYWGKFEPYLSGKAWIYLPLYSVLALTLGLWLEIYQISYFPDLVSWPLFFLLIAAVFSCAYSEKTISENLLRRQDISYGIYVYHAIVLNVLIQLNKPIEESKSFSDFWLVMGISTLLAALSWVLVEQPALRRKDATTHKV